MRVRLRFNSDCRSREARLVKKPMGLAVSRPAWAFPPLANKKTRKKRQSNRPANGRAFLNPGGTNLWFPAFTTTPVWQNALGLSAKNLVKLFRRRGLLPGRSRHCRNQVRQGPLLN